MHVHLDPVGGIAGDMIIAALLDAYPELVPGMDAANARVESDDLGAGRGRSGREHLRRASEAAAPGQETKDEK